MVARTLENKLEEVRRISRECIPDSPRGLTDPRTGRQVIGVWLPEPLEKFLIAEAEAPEKEKTRIAAIKYFTPDGAGTWWLSEYNPEDRLFYGLCKIQEAEYGYVSLDELRATRGHLGLHIERDFYFEPCLLTEVESEGQREEKEEPAPYREDQACQGFYCGAAPLGCSDKRYCPGPPTKKPRSIHVNTDMHTNPNNPLNKWRKQARF